jgi:hypothetical protein
MPATKRKFRVGAWCLWCHYNRSHVTTVFRTRGLWLVACGLWLVARGLWLVACGLWLLACAMRTVVCARSRYHKVAGAVEVHIGVDLCTPVRERRPAGAVPTRGEEGDGLQ